MINKFKLQWKKDYFKSIVIIKVAVMIGLIAAYFLPQEHAWLAGMSANILWLWRT